MTSRTSTPFLPRQDGASAKLPRAIPDLAVLGTFALLNAPFLLRSLYGGSERDKQALIDRLELPRNALPHAGGWKADIGLLNLLADEIFDRRPGRVVEFGAGASTLIIAKALEKAGLDSSTFISFEQHADFCERTQRWLSDFGARSDIRHAPLVRAPGGWPGLWYDHGHVRGPIDLLLIDGPQWTIHPFTRGAAATLFDQIGVGGCVILDDAARPGERVIAHRWRRQWPNFDFRFHRAGSKGALIGRRLA